MRPAQIDRTQGPYNFVACARGPKDTVSLEYATKLPQPRDGRSFVHIYPRAGEAVVVAVCSHRKVDRTRKPGGAKDPERTKAEAVRRARTTARRYATEHRLRFMWTLTYRPPFEFDIKRVRRHIERLVKEVAKVRGERFPYLWVPEFHADGERIHIHVAVPFYFDQKRLTKIWGRGHVFCTDKKPRGGCAFAAAQRSARYLCKYIGKAFEVAEFGNHRYERAQGFAITSHRVRRYDMPDGVEYATNVFGCSPVFQWSSSNQEGWTGPSVEVMFFAGEPPDE